jgi:hypothetical protein
MDVQPTIAELDSALHTMLNENDALRAEIKKLRVENAGLVDENRRLLDWILGDADAHTTLQSIYLDPDAPQANRIKAASAALPVEKPKLTSVAPPLELTAIELVPLPELLMARTERQNQLEGQPIEPDGQILLPRPGNGDGSNTLLAGSVAPNVLKRFRRHRGIAHRVGDAGMA